MHDLRLCEMKMRPSFFAVPLAVAALLVARSAYCAGSCGHECSREYRDDVLICQTITDEKWGGEDKTCVDNARDDYDRCVQDCTDPLGLTLAK
jgi:hypothetical protein